MPVTEHEVEYAIDTQLSASGWLLDPKDSKRNVYKQQARTEEQSKQLGRSRPDYVLYAHEGSNRPTVVIEAKRPGKSLSEALEQGTRYAKKLKAPIVVATDGWRVKTQHVEADSPLLIDEREIEELFGPDLARTFALSHNFSSFSKDVFISQEELIAKFKKANTILKNEGLSAGIERFSEFANLMFLKLQMEGGGGGGEIAGHTWPDIEAKKGPALLKSVKQMFAELRKENRLFEQSKISDPSRMERLIEILSSFRLSSVRNDIKGIAFEHFIHSYTRGTKNDLGQYFTPRHVVRMMVHFLKPAIGETIYDPFCGTGGMLIECFRYINQHIQDPREQQILRGHTLFGRDNSSAARIAMMNMIMFGDGHSNIEQGDSYFRHGAVKGKYDIVITNIPFSQETDAWVGYPVPPKGIKNGDSIGVQHCLESLKEKESARAAVIVPIGFLHKEALQEEREHILKNFDLERVVELSPKCFQPYTEQQTAILVVRRKRQTGKVQVTFPYYRVMNDGYSQDGYRVALPGENDMDRAMDDKGASLNPTQLGGGSRFKQLNSYIPKDHLKLSELAKVTVGAGNISPKTKIADVKGGIHPIMMVADLAKKHIDYSLRESAYRITDEAVAKKSPYLFPKDSILIPITGKAALLNHRGLLHMPAYATSTLAGIEALEGKLHPYCLFYFFLNFDVSAISYDLGYPGVNKSTLEGIPVPNYTDKQQQQIIARVAECIQLSERLYQSHQRNIDTQSPS